MTSMKPQVVCFLLFTLVSAALSQNSKCPFDYIYHFGDGVTDVGNSVLVRPFGPSLPAARRPYGMTLPGKPNGRWSDGLIDFDFAAAAFGFPKLVPYLAKNSSLSNGVIFSVARSPVLDREFFASRGVRVPPYVVSLNQQLKWFKTYLKSVCSTKKDCAKIIGNSLMLLGDIEGNDIGYALSQGKSIKEVTTYIPYVTQAQIKITKELIKMGATKIIIPGTAPLGCYPYILTARSTRNPAAYDSLGCLKDVNNLINLKNNDLQKAAQKVSQKNPSTSIYYGPFDTGVLAVLRETSRSGSNKNLLKSCCGIGGRYNYDSKRFCGSPGVPVCKNPNEFFFWDGLHFTHRTSERIVEILVPDALRALNCTV